MRFVFAITTALALVPAGAASGAPDRVDSHDLSGTWTLNAWLTDPGEQIERELTADLGPPNQHEIAGDDRAEPPRRPRDAMGRGGMDRPRTTIGSAPAKALLNADDNRRIQSLIDAVRQPAVTLTIAQDGRGITIADLRGSRTFPTSGTKQEQPLDTGTIAASTRWEGPQLVTDYDVRRGVTLRFSYMLVPEGDHLLVRISVLTPGGEPAPYVIRHVYTRATKG